MAPLGSPAFAAQIADLCHAALVAAATEHPQGPVQLIEACAAARDFASTIAKRCDAAIEAARLGDPHAAARLIEACAAARDSLAREAEQRAGQRVA
jgi:hypothetical protein